jgi:hypothetical protein
MIIIGLMSGKNTRGEDDKKKGVGWEQNRSASPTFGQWRLLTDNSVLTILADTNNVGGCLFRESGQ